MQHVVANFIKYKDLFIELIIRDIQLKYRNSFFGILWSLLNPIFMTAVLSIVFMTLFKGDIEYFPLYVLIGRTIYSFFSESTNFAMDSIHQSSHLITKVYVPKYFFPVTKICSVFISTLISLIPVIALMAIYKIPFTFNMVFAVLPLLYLFILSIGFGLILASVNVFFNDMKHFYGILLTLIMYMTPIFYPKSIIPEEYIFILNSNPLLYIVELFRNILMYNASFDLSMHLTCLSIALISLVIGVFTFYKSQDKFIYYI